MTQFYNLDAIISVDYRVNSRKATNFRIWATGVLKESMTKGFVMDDERLKQGETVFAKGYFKELLFAECSIDYDKHSEITKDFYAMVQNKFHFAITGKTAVEIIDTMQIEQKKIWD